MPAAEVVTSLLRPLEASGIDYMVTGGLAAIIYGEPRLTLDADIVAVFGPGDVQRLVGAFPAAEYYVPPIDVLVEETSRSQHGHFNLLHLDSAIRGDIYVAGDDPLASWALARRRWLTLDGTKVAIAPIEYVIVMKLRYFRESGSDRHLRDIAAMLRLSGDLIDRSALDAWVRRCNVESVWAKVATASPGTP